MTETVKDSVFLISHKDKRRKKFGTGFVIHHENDSSYIVTCRHVLSKICKCENNKETINKEFRNIDVGGVIPGKVISIGDEPIDIAVLKVNGLKTKALILYMGACEHLKIKIPGCAELGKAHQIIPITGQLEKSVERVQSGSKIRIDSWILKIDDGHEIHEGYSGSPVIDENENVIGIVSHKKGDKTGYAIPVDVLPDLWKEMPEGLLKNELIKGDDKKWHGDYGSETGESDTADQTTEPDPEVRNKVITEIGKILEDKRLSLLKETLVQEIKKEITAEDENEIQKLEEDLVELGCLEAIYVLKNSVKECLNSIERASVQIDDVWKGALAILGWLVLLSVNYMWINKQKKGNKGVVNGISLEVPAKKESELEIVFSAYMGTKAKLSLEMKENRPVIRGENRIKTHTPEVGWEKKDIIHEIMKDLWKIIYKIEPPETFSADDKDMLKESLKIENRDKRNIYVAVDGKELSNPLRNRDICIKVKNELSVNILLLTVGEPKSILMVPSSIMEASLIAFFLNKPE